MIHSSKLKFSDRGLYLSLSLIDTCSHIVLKCSCFKSTFNAHIIGYFSKMSPCFLNPTHFHLLLMLFAVNVNSFSPSSVDIMCYRLGLGRGVMVYYITLYVCAVCGCVIKRFNW